MPGHLQTVAIHSFHDDMLTTYCVKPSLLMSKRSEVIRNKGKHKRGVSFVLKVNAGHLSGMWKARNEYKMLCRKYHVKKNI